MTSFFRKLKWFIQGRREAELREELQFHLDEEAEERTAHGLQHEDAQWAARRDLGNVTLVEESTRATWAWTFFEQLVQDLRYAMRAILHNRAFTLLAVLSLALGIGANTAIYSFMDALLLRSLPVSDPQKLVALNWHVSGAKSLRDSVVHDVSGHFFNDPKTGRTTAIFPYPAFEALRKSDDVFSVLFAYHPRRKLNLMMRGQAEITDGESVSGDYFRGLGVAPAAGRLIADEDDRAGAPPVAVLSYAFAQKRFGDARSAAEQPVLINNIPFTAIGVAPPGFFGVDPAKAPDFYLPLHSTLVLTPDLGPDGGAGQRFHEEHDYWLEMMGRLKPGVTIAQARAILTPRFEGWVASTATNEKERKNLPEFLLKEASGGLDNLRREYSQPLYLLLAMVGLILAIACANIANLLLARATARRREMAVRLSMGAGRWRVIRQLLTESLLLASIGGVVGILFAIWGVQVLTLLLSDGDQAFTLQAELNWHVLGAAAGLTMITGLLFGLAPALQATRVDVMPVLREVRTGGRRSRFTFSQILVVSQMAISLLLLVAAGLFVRTLSNLQSIDVGFQRQSILVFKLNARQAGHRDPEILSFYSDLQQRFAAIPGVRSATVTNSPLIGDGAWGWPVVPIGKQVDPKAPSGHGSGAADTTTHVLATGPGFFSTMKIPLLAGREFDERDRSGSPPVAIVNEAWVKTNMDGRNPMGQHVVSHGLDSKPRDMEIIGVAKNTKYDDLRDKLPAIVYMPYQQNLGMPAEEMTFLLYTAGDPLSHASAVREIVHRADARVPVTNLRSQDAEIAEEMTQEILFARLCTGFAMLALVIACIGLYGTMSYTVARRTSEIGIRIALGARRAGVIWMVLRQVIVMAIIGLAIGLSVAYGLSRLVQSFLFGVKPNDPVALAIAVGMLIIAAILAGYAPARRASRIDPITSLRHE